VIFLKHGIFLRELIFLHEESFKPSKLQSLQKILFSQKGFSSYKGASSKRDLSRNEELIQKGVNTKTEVFSETDYLSEWKNFTQKKGGDSFPKVRKLPLFFPKGTFLLQQYRHNTRTKPPAQITVLPTQANPPRNGQFVYLHQLLGSC